MEHGPSAWPYQLGRGQSTLQPIATQVFRQLRAQVNMFAALSAETPSDGEYNAVFQGRRMLSRLIEPKTSLELSARIKGAPLTRLKTFSPLKPAPCCEAVCVRNHRMVDAIM